MQYFEQYNLETFSISCDTRNCAISKLNAQISIELNDHKELNNH